MPVMQATIARARELNSEYCWSPDKQHLWGIANRHYWRIRAMYRGRPWREVEAVEDALKFDVSECSWMRSGR